MALKYDKSENEITLCHEFTSDFEAHIAMAALQQVGIECFIENEIFSRLYPVGGLFGGVRLMVFKRDLPKANDIINSLHLDGN